jgi:D-lactate dehydrogenase
VVGLVDTHAVIRGLKSRIIGGLAIDVYEEETAMFFQDFV